MRRACHGTRVRRKFKSSFFPTVNMHDHFLRGGLLKIPLNTHLHLITAWEHGCMVQHSGGARQPDTNQSSSAWGALQSSGSDNPHEGVASELNSKQEEGQRGGGASPQVTLLSVKLPDNGSSAEVCSHV